VARLDQLECKFCWKFGAEQVSLDDELNYGNSAVLLKLLFGLVLPIIPRPQNIEPRFCRSITTHGGTDNPVPQMTAQDILNSSRLIIQA
jgi:hypothetical protein